MLTLRQFGATVDSYGGDLQRWPEELRGEAETLLNSSAQARSLLTEARRLDELIKAAGAHEEATLWPRGEHEAALARLRSDVAVRLASSTGRRPFGLLPGWIPAAIAHWIPSMPINGFGMVTGSGIAVVAGFLLGFMRVAAPAEHSVLALLQLSPL